jgi:hypothetical protein
MPPTATTAEQPNFNLYGTVTPDEEQQLKQVGPEAELFAQAVRQRVGMETGDLVGSQELSLALVVGKDEQGNDVPSHYIALGDDFGTTVRVKSESGLSGREIPDVETGWKMLQERAASQKDAESTDESSRFNELAYNPNAMLQRDNLELFADPSTIYDALQDANAAGNKEEANLTQDLHDRATRFIFAPEASAQVAEQLTTMMAATVLDELPRLDTAYGMLSEKVSTSDLALEDIRQRLPAVMNLLTDTRDTLHRGGKLEESSVHDFYNLAYFVQDYRTALVNAKASSDEELGGVRYAQSTVDQISEDVQGRRARINNEVDDTMSAGPNMNYSETINAVVERGAASVNEHYESCEDQKEKLSTDAAELAISLDNFYNHHSALRGQMSAREQATEDMPHPYNVDATIGGLTRFVSGFAYGEGYSAQSVAELIEQTGAMIQSIEAGITRRSQNGEAVFQALDAAKQATAALRQLPILTNNR